MSEFIAPYCAEKAEILHADSDVLVVNKPAGLLSVPGKHPDNKDSLISRLQADFPEARIVHRLDMATSGLMIIALNPDSHRALSRQFEHRKVEKAYVARVFGRVDARRGAIELPLACDWPNRPRQHINFDYGKPAQTWYECLDRSAKETTLLLKPVTGRSHQLRVHCASIGHPILGCEFYAHPAAKAAAERLLLHASELIFSHPVSAETMSFSCAAPF